MARAERDSGTNQSPGAQLCARLDESWAHLMAAITGMDDQALRTRTTPGTRTPSELLAHLYLTERIFMERARTAIEQPGYQVTPVSDEVRQEHLTMAKQMPVPQIIHGLVAQRRETLDFVRQLSQEQLQCGLQHPNRGDQTVRWQIEHIIDHEFEHAAELGARRLTAGLAPA